MNEVTVGIGGAAGDGIDKSGDTLAKSGSRSGLHAYGFNSYQSVIRGGHIWLKLRAGRGEGLFAGRPPQCPDRPEPGLHRAARPGSRIGRRDFVQCRQAAASIFPIRDNVLTVPLPVAQADEALSAPSRPVMQNTVALGALVFLLGMEFDITASVLADTFAHKGKAIIDQNVGVPRPATTTPASISCRWAIKWKFSRKRRPFLTGNEAFSIGAVAAGCRFYSAYPMTPASGILTWMADHAERCGSCRQADGRRVGGGQRGHRRRICRRARHVRYFRRRLRTDDRGHWHGRHDRGAGGVHRSAARRPFHRHPHQDRASRSEPGLWRVAGRFPARSSSRRPDTRDCFDSAVEAFNLAEKYQLPVIIISDLQLSEHPETVEPEDHAGHRAHRPRRAGHRMERRERRVQAIRIYHVGRFSARVARHGQHLCTSWPPTNTTSTAS